MSNISTIVASNLYLVAVLFPVIVAVIVLSVHMLLNSGRNEVVVPPTVFTQVSSQNTPMWVTKHVHAQYVDFAQAQRDAVARERIAGYLSRH